MRSAVYVATEATLGAYNQWVVSGGANEPWAVAMAGVSRARSCCGAAELLKLATCSCRQRPGAPYQGEWPACPPPEAAAQGGPGNQASPHEQRANCAPSTRRSSSTSLLTPRLPAPRPAQVHAIAGRTYLPLFDGTFESLHFVPLGQEMAERLRVDFMPVLVRVEEDGSLCRAVPRAWLIQELLRYALKTTNINKALAVRAQQSSRPGTATSHFTARVAALTPLAPTPTRRWDSKSRRTWTSRGCTSTRSGTSSARSACSSSRR